MSKTVKQWAETTKMDVADLVKKLQQANIPLTDPDQKMTENQEQKLIAYLLQIRQAKKPAAFSGMREVESSVVPKHSKTTTTVRAKKRRQIHVPPPEELAAETA